MNYIAYTARFLYRIKWWLILAPIIVALAVFFKMGAQPRNYKSMTTVYTGIVSGYDITTTEGTRQDWNIINNAMDNLITSSCRRPRSRTSRCAFTRRDSRTSIRTTTTST